MVAIPYPACWVQIFTIKDCCKNYGFYGRERDAWGHFLNKVIKIQTANQELPLNNSK